MLTIVPTPLGNLGDVTERIVRTLSEADAIAAEDTRHSGTLLHALKLRKPMVSLHDHNEGKRSEELVCRMLAGEHIALVSDAGMPLVSDPGYRLVRLCIEKGVPVSVLPGPSAVITALAGSGLPPLPFYFGGFLPVKSGRRASELSAAIERGITSIYFESPFRLTKTLETLAELFPTASICVARELTKKFEEFRRGTAPSLLDHFSKTPPKGEITLLLHPESLFGSTTE